jgi:hypothetical protein
MLLEGPYATQPNRVIYQEHDPLREYAIRFVSTFGDPLEGYVNAESIRARLGDFSDLLHTPSKYAARIAQTDVHFGRPKRQDSA